MSDKQGVDFIEYLDKYRTVRHCRYNDYVNILNLINENYHFNDINDKNFTGVTAKKDSRDNYYHTHSPSLWNATTTQKDKISIDTLYTIWQKNHETDISFNLLPTAMPPVVEPDKIYNVVIDAKINTVQDLINIVEKNEYYANTSYNIDLKSLHCIKEDLINLNNMIGMENLKKSILDQLLYFIQELHVGKQVSEFKHTVLCGLPGTGKTEIAKILGVMYSKIGVLKSNIFKKVTRNDLIAGYLGQTAIKTKKVIQESLGGVLFIDEAYSLASPEQSDIYSKECLDTICEALSDHKDNLMVIIAGYEEELEETFFKTNRGLESRFIWRFKMDPYNSLEMMKIFKKKVLEHEWNFEKEDDIKEKWFADKKEMFKHFGRDMELLFTYTKISHSRRIYGKDKECRKKISLDDMNEGYETFLKNRKKKTDNQFIHTLFI